MYYNYSRYYEILQVMKRTLLAIIIISPILLFASCVQTNSGGDYDQLITVGGHELMVEIVKTDEERSKGLSGRSGLTDSEGMLFDFTDTTISRPSFWMKDMKFDIDIIWIYNDRVVELTEDVATTYTNVNLPSYSPSVDITHVLEVNSGWIERNGISVGDKITY